MDKVKKGRPRMVSTEIMTIIKHLFPDVKTTRGRQNKYYEQQALRVLTGIDGMEFIRDPKKNTCKSSILIELGRMVMENSDETATEIAKQICEDVKTNTKKLSVHGYAELVKIIRVDMRTSLGNRFLK